jgi:hypothetical protein
MKKSTLEIRRHENTVEENAINPKLTKNKAYEPPAKRLKSM